MKKIYNFQILWHAI